MPEGSKFHGYEIVDTFFVLVYDETQGIIYKATYGKNEMGKDVFRSKGAHQDIFSFFTFIFQKITSPEVIFLSEKMENCFRIIRVQKKQK
jgi:hypothetical protein